MRNGLPYYKAYPRDFIEGTIGMAFEAKCAYRVILDLIYMQGGRLPDDPRYISGLLGCSIRKWKSIRKTLLDLDKVYVSGEFLANYRADNEIETLAKHQDKQAENRHRPNKNKDLETPKPNHTEPEPEPDKRDTSVSPKKPRRSMAIPPDWVPSDANIQHALSKHLSPEEIQNEADRFRDYHIANGTTFKDWDAGWRTWVGKAIEYRSRRNRGMASQANSARYGQGGGLAGAVARRRLDGEV